MSNFIKFHRLIFFTGEDFSIYGKCDPLSENLALCANIEFELEAILSVQVVSQLNSDYCTNVSQWAWTVSY